MSPWTAYCQLAMTRRRSETSTVAAAVKILQAAIAGLTPGGDDRQDVIDIDSAVTICITRRADVVTVGCADR